jgi:hypothetical protein
MKVSTMKVLDRIEFEKPERDPLVSRAFINLGAALGIAAGRRNA